MIGRRHDRLFDKVNIVLVGKYTALQDSYTSVVKSLEHASLQCARKLIITVRLVPSPLPVKRFELTSCWCQQWVEASDLEPEAQNTRPKEFHAAWQAVCTAKYVVSFDLFQTRANPDYRTVESSFPEGSAFVEPRA